MKEFSAERVREISQEIRLIAAEMSHARANYIGASLSVADIVSVLYFSTLDITLERLNDPERDFVAVSKGTGSSAIYAALHMLGLIEKQDLLNHSTLDSPIYHSVSKKIPGIELTTGSLGLGFAVALGAAIAQKRMGYTSRSFAIIGDGELDEGANWETALGAPAFDVGDHLVAIIDRNGRQANMPTEDLIPLKDLPAKWREFGWRTVEIDGHNHQQVYDALHPDGPQSKPLAVIANTVRGKGISFLEDRKDRWRYELNDEEFQRACDEIRGVSAKPTQCSAAPSGGCDTE